MQITLKDIKAGKAIQLEVAADETIAAVKARVEAEHAIPAAQQRLIFRGKTVPDAQSLRDLGIQKDAMLHLVYKLASSQPVEIRALTGQTLTLDVQPSYRKRSRIRAREP